MQRQKQLHEYIYNNSTQIRRSTNDVEVIQDSKVQKKTLPHSNNEMQKCDLDVIRAEDERDEIFFRQKYQCQPHDLYGVPKSQPPPQPSQQPSESKLKQLTLDHYEFQFQGKAAQPPPVRHSFFKDRDKDKVLKFQGSQYLDNLFKSTDQSKPLNLVALKPISSFQPPQQPPPKKQSGPEPQKIDLNKLPEAERSKILHDLGMNQRQKQAKKEQEAKVKQQKQLQSLSNEELRRRGLQDYYELCKEDKVGSANYQAIQIKRKEETESKALSTYKMIMNFNEQEGKPLFEFNRLLKFLFLKDYSSEEKEEDSKTIPNNFVSADEYTKIFEYLFLNEAAAQMKSDLLEFMRKMQANRKFRRIQVRRDESENDKDGTILVMRAAQPSKKDLEGSDAEQEEDGICDLSTLKNYIVLLAKTRQFKLQKLNNYGSENFSFLGMLIDPHKNNINGLKIQTFIKKDCFSTQWTDIILFPVQKLTTQIREYLMIQQIQFTPLASVIFDPSINQQLIGQDLKNPWSIQCENLLPNLQCLQSFIGFVQGRYNESQARSITEIVRQERGICLLQGPPGTGKTHTLLGLLSGVYEYMSLTNRFPKKKILICAPSNAAIDEIILRILAGGIFDSTGKSRKVRLIRLGLLDEENEKSDLIKEVSLEDKAQRLMYSKQVFKAQADQKTVTDLRIELSQLMAKQKKLEGSKRKSALAQGLERDIDAQLYDLNDRRRQIVRYIEEIRVNKRKYKETYSEQIEKILNEAEIICSTLSSSGSDKLLKYTDNIDILIVDEAAQCTEPTNIIPLRLNIKKMVLIGDPRQLPATTFSVSSSKTLYNRSLFERILDNQFKPYFLDTQYRMHSEIRQFPSMHFYENKLIDHESTNGRDVPEAYFRRRMIFLDSYDAQESKDNTSYINRGEAQIVIKILQHIRELFPQQTTGIICGYKAQVRLIKSLLKQAENRKLSLAEQAVDIQDDNTADNSAEMQLDDMPAENQSGKTQISINTVDSFQGQEKDIIIFTCVRSSEKGGIGFLSDGRRMNVALTRARNTLIIIGNARTLIQNNLWRSLLRNVSQRQIYRKASVKDDSLPRRVIEDEWMEEECKMEKSMVYMMEQKDTQRYAKQSFRIEDFNRSDPKQNQIEGTRAYEDDIPIDQLGQKGLRSDRRKDREEKNHSEQDPKTIPNAQENKARKEDRSQGKETEKPKKRPEHLKTGKEVGKADGKIQQGERIGKDREDLKKHHYPHQQQDQHQQQQQKLQQQQGKQSEAGQVKKKDFKGVNRTQCMYETDENGYYKTENLSLEDALKVEGLL